MLGNFIPFQAIKPAFILQATGRPTSFYDLSLSSGIQGLSEVVLGFPQVLFTSTLQGRCIPLTAGERGFKEPNDLLIKVTEPGINETDMQTPVHLTPRHMFSPPQPAAERDE